MRIENLIPNTYETFREPVAKPVDSSVGFKDIFKNIVSEARNLREIDMTNNKLMATGEIDSLDNVMIDMEKADIALQFTMQIRNKILDAYQEIMRMQI